MNQTQDKLNAMETQLAARNRSQGVAEQIQDRAAGQGYSSRVLSPVEDAHKLIAADSEHRSLAADQALMLRMTMPMLGTGLRTLAQGIYQWCAHQGFWPGGIETQESEKMKKAEKIALIHSEVSEMLEAIRKGDRSNEGEEAADVAIRLLDYCGRYGIDLGSEIERKMLKNYQRPFRHGKAF